MNGSLKYAYYNKAFEDGMRYMLMVMYNRRDYLDPKSLVNVGFHVLDQYKKLKKKDQI